MNYKQSSKETNLSSVERIKAGLKAGELLKPVFDAKAVAATMQRNRDRAKKLGMKNE